MRALASIIGAALALPLPACKQASDSAGEDGSVDASGGTNTTGSGSVEGSASDDGIETGTGGATSTGSETAAFSCDDVPIITYDTFGRGFLATYCNGCHGGLVENRQNAPESVVFDTREQASDFADRILARSLPDEGVTPMPPAGGITPDDSERARIWLTCYP